MSGRRFLPGWWIIPGLVGGVVLVSALATCAHAATGGADTPIYQCFDLPPLSANGIGPRGEPSDTYLAMVQERNARELVEFIDSLTPAYITGGSGRGNGSPATAAPASPALPSVDLPPGVGPFAACLIAVCGIAAIARKKK
ncbi:hypothetical protein [Paenirhodobacter populi]|uniref:VPLPA-CTERM sorting domain-containing protein n=1 Tax=Paenirhodobacter populi TaxID=2306993 RepID=A0A443JEK8_9RHOB|nr:hypothetical protein [Sinirhodobacter populi]RWR18823.1 hypothetical protein D2T30_15810 [Sinirhodobacter populi]